MRAGGRCAHKFYGGRAIEVYPADKIYEEAAFIAYYMHWPHDEIMAMSHLDRLRWCSEISKINRALNDEPQNIFDV
ncbi:MAG: hypothetical protein NC180_09480 [Muribaculaceae bacterium]|nr:hypothetical protein [Roseburia sp.]MCM1431879.1 hypothetical protein [Muribaculaceae bacterium]MCM1493439.1 hypothetical protein [Muribaculaceae bacterium]